MALFHENAYLITICFSKMAIFDVFPEIGHFLDLFWTPLVLTEIHCFGGIRFSLGKSQKVVILENY